MEIKRYVPMGPARWLIYGGFQVAALVTAGYLITRAEWPATITALALVTATTYIVARLMVARYAYGQQIAWYTRQGLAVLPGDARPVLEPRRGELEADIESVIFWWAQKYPAQERQIRDFINGGYLVVLRQDEPIVDKRWNIIARELTAGNHMRVLWQPANNGKDFLPLVRHGIGHMCLYALGIPNEGKDDHHARMLTEGFPDR